jgi:hypothetical protein
MGQVQSDIDPSGILDKGTKRRKRTLHQFFNHDGQFGLDKTGKFFGRYPRCRMGKQLTERGGLIQCKKYQGMLGHSVYVTTTWRNMFAIRDDMSVELHFSVMCW